MPAEQEIAQQSSVIAEGMTLGVQLSMNDLGFPL